MEKIDVAVQSYKKPESLIYTLLTLHKYCKDYIDTIYIDDDKSGGDEYKIYTSDSVIRSLSPWKIKVRINEEKAGLYFFTDSMLKRGHCKFQYYYYKLRKRNPIVLKSEEDIRYQWAINATDKKYLLLIHDDVKFVGDICSILLKSIDSNTSIVGELGQCWRCSKNNICNPKKVFATNFHPYSTYPTIRSLDVRKKRICRINEWACLLNATIAKKIACNDKVYFGSYEHFGDIGAYWFDYVYDLEYEFHDPFVENNLDKNDYYIHCWQGFSGHSVWEDQGQGIKTYDKDMIKSLIKKEFNVKL